MPINISGNTLGQSTKDATALPEDVRSGKTFYATNGKETGIWKPKVTDYTTDATANPDDVRLGKVFYGKTGKQSGLLNIKEEKTTMIEIKDTEDVAPFKRKNQVSNFYGEYSYGHSTVWDTPVTVNDYDFVTLADNMICYIHSFSDNSSLYYSYDTDIYKYVTIPSNVSDVWVECIGKCFTIRFPNDTVNINSEIRFHNNSLNALKRNNKKWILGQMYFFKKLNYDSSYDHVFAVGENGFTHSSSAAACILFGWKDGSLIVGIGFTAYEASDELPAPYDESDKYYFDMNMKFIVHYTT